MFPKCYMPSWMSLGSKCVTSVPKTTLVYVECMSTGAEKYCVNRPRIIHSIHRTRTWKQHTSLWWTIGLEWILEANVWTISRFVVRKCRELSSLIKKSSSKIWKNVSHWLALYHQIALIAWEIEAEKNLSLLALSSKNYTNCGCRRNQTINNDC